MSPTEILDIVDEQDVVIGQATRADIHARGLLHRAVHVFVFNSAGRLLVQLRTAEKDEFPLCYTSSASGHIDSGEDYETAAVREMEEELGLTSPIEFLTKLPAGPSTANEHSALFRTVTDAEPVFDAVEIISGEYLRLEEIMADIVADPERYTPPFRELLAWYQQETAGGSGGSVEK